MSPVAVPPARVPAVDPGLLLAVAARSTWISSSAALHKWLAGEMCSVIPHDALLVAKRDVRNGDVTCEVVGTPRAMKVRDASASLPQSVEGLFERWLAAGRNPITVTTEGFDHAGTSLDCEAILAHGVADERANADYLYMFLGTSQLHQPETREASTMLLPFIDCGCRKLLGRDGATEERQVRAPSRPAGLKSLTGGDLSQREVEIMRWVCEGKKNYEIGELLGLSKATVKNHMRRIYQKLDVMNRAQAVETFERVVAPALTPH
jgi:transcriptional regulator EpsA